VDGRCLDQRLTMRPTNLTTRLHPCWPPRIEPKRKRQCAELTGSRYVPIVYVHSRSWAIDDGMPITMNTTYLPQAGPPGVHRHERISMIARLIAIVAIVILGMLPKGAGAANVSGTDAVFIRSCPSLDCDILGTAPLGASLEITGDLENGFLPVIWEGTSGFAYSLFVSDAEASPWLVQGDATCNQVALIFNIGIGEEPSQAIIDTLILQNVPASMFPMGWWAIENPDYLRQLDRAGFVIGTHGDQQRFLTSLDDGTIVNDVTTSIDAIQSVIGRPIDPWFTPYAADTDERVRSIVAGMGVMPVGWTVTANDFGPEATSDSVYGRVMEAVHPGAIVELHLDGQSTDESTAAALPAIVNDLRARGYDLVTVPELASPCDLPR